jgi:hypothetical protein
MRPGVDAVLRDKIQNKNPRNPRNPRIAFIRAINPFRVI